jgi:hypothetical protein
MNNTLDRSNSTLENTEEKISELDDKGTGTIPYET